MSITVLTAPTDTALTSVAAVQVEVPTADTALTGSLILQASAAIATYCNRVWGTSTVTESIPGTGRLYLGLTRTPLVTVGTVTEDSTAITDYSVEDADAGSLYRAIGWPAGAGGWDQVAYTSGYILPWAARLRYVASYSAGYTLPGTAGTATSTLPRDVERAAIETVKAWWQARTGHDPSVARKQAGDVSVSYTSGATATVTTPLPPLATQLLAPWRRPPFRY